MDNQKPHDNDALVVFPSIHDGAAEPDTAISTHVEREADDESEASGAREIVPRAREKTPRAKVVLIFHDSFLHTKRRVKECTFVQSVIDLLEIVGVVIDIYDADPAVIEKVGEKMLERRA